MAGFGHLLAIGMAASVATAWSAALAGTLGGGGTILTPSARIGMAGGITAGLSADGAWRHLYLSATPLPWAELTVRRSVLPDVLAEDGADFALRLLAEGPAVPQVVIGRRSFTGGEHAASYLALSRRVWNLDLTLGLGTGALAGRHAFDLPFGSFRASPFAAAAWDLTGTGLSVLAEYDPGPRAGSPLNLGLRWKATERLDLTLAWSRGEHATAGLALRLDAGSRPAMAAGSPPPLPAIRPQRPEAESGPAEPRLSAALAAEGIHASAVRVAPPVATVWIEELGDGPPATAAGRAARVLAREAPPDVERLDLILQPGRLDGTAVSLLRSGLERAARHHGSPAELWLTGRLGPVGEDPPERPDRLSLTLSPLVEIDPGSDGGALLGRAALDVGASWHHGSWLTAGTLRLNRPFGPQAPGQMPAKAGLADRGDFARVPATVARAYGAWLASPGEGWHLRHAGGLLDEMHAGTSSEALYRPVGARWAAGAGLDLVLERVPGTLLVRPEPLRAWSVGLYRDDADGKGALGLRAGRYLGGDLGATLSLRRELGHGLRLSAHATWTGGVSGRPHAGYGLGLLLPLQRPAGLPVTVRPELRLSPSGPAGRQLDQPLPLHELTSPASYGAVAGSWERLLD
jgi:hypothetical protein